MGCPAEDASVGKIVAEAFNVQDPAIRTLIGEMESTRSGQRADALAQRLGLRNRFQLAHRLAGAHVPSLVELRSILRVLTWVCRWETEGLSLAEQALIQGHDPAAWYKTVHRVTGHCWRDIRETGTHKLAAKLAARFGSST